MLAEDKRIKTKEQLKDWLDYEMAGYGGAKLSDVLMLTEGAILRRHQQFLRKGEYHANTGHRLRSIYYRFRVKRIQNRYCLHIARNCCGRGLRILHLGPILMNGHITVGENCSIHINTSIVAGGSNNGVPTVGDNVSIGVGAVILGDVYVADGIAIGANAVVNKSFTEPNIAIAGVPARKISDNGSNTWGQPDRG